MSTYEHLIQCFLKDLQTGIRMPVKVSNDEWGEKWIQYDAILKHYCTATVPRKCFLSKYKSILPIEAIPNEEKIEWRKFVNSIFPGSTPEFRLEAIKIIYCIGVLTS